MACMMTPRSKRTERMNGTQTKDRREAQDSPAVQAGSAAAGLARVDRDRPARARLDVGRARGPEPHRAEVGRRAGGAEDVSRSPAAGHDDAPVARRAHRAADGGSAARGYLGARSGERVRAQ